MTAAATDLLMEVGLPGTATTLASPGYTSGATSINVVSTTNWPTGTGVAFAIDQAEVVNGVEVRIDGTYCEFSGVVSSATQITGMTLEFGTPQNYAAGALTRVYVPVSSERENRLVQWGTVQHKQTGAHAAITTDSIVNAGALTQTGASTFTGAMTIKSYDGWITGSNTWTYVSGTGTVTGVFKITGVDATGYLEPGVRVKLTQNSVVKYGIITKVAFSTDTTVTLLMSATSGTVDNTGLENLTISSPAFSRDKAPFGFPIDPARWTITFSSSVDRTTSSGTYVSLTDTATAPIGAWIMTGRLVLYATTNGSTTYLATTTWSTTTTTETHPDTTVRVIDRLDAAGRAVGATLSFQTYINVAAATTFTLLGAASNSLNVYGSTYSPTKVTFTCAYL